MISKLIQFWKKRKAAQQRKLCCTPEKLEKDIKEYKKSAAEKFLALSESIKKLEAEIGELNEALSKSTAKEKTRLERIIETKVERLEKKTLKKKESQRTFPINLEYLEDSLSRLRSKQLEPDINAVMMQSEESLFRYRLMQETVEAIKEGQNKNQNED